MTQSNDSANAETVAEQLDVIRADIERLAKLVAELAAGKAETAKESAKSMASEARERADAYREDAAKKASDAYKTGQDAVRKYPTLAVGLALGTGVLLGRSVLRRF